MTNKTQLSLIASAFGWFGLIIFVAVLPLFKPENGTFVLLMLPYVFFAVITNFLAFSGSIIAMATAISVLCKDKSDKLAFFSFVAGFLGLCLLIYAEHHQ